jgi:homoserine dehydrogenase
MGGEIRVGLLGYGTVGSNVDRLLQRRARDLERRLGRRLRAVRALVRDPGKERPFAPAPGVLTTSFADLRDDASLDVVAEVMGGLEPAERYVRDLLEGGKPVATANKQLIARRGPELAELAAAVGVPLRFEAAVCGAVPVVRVLCDALAPGSVRRLSGVVNGTANFVLTRMETGVSFERALAEAQEHGYAEPDPSQDVSGLDAAAKMAILATLAFGNWVTLADVEWEGIDGLEPRDLAAARSRGRRLRLIGEATKDCAAPIVRVGLRELPAAHPLAQVAGVLNTVLVEGDGIGELTLRAPGAGGPETASAVVADLLALTGASSACQLTRLAPPTVEVRM